MTRSEESRFELLAMEYVEPMYRLAFSRVGNAEDAQDIVQETFIKAYKSFNSLSTEKSLKQWLTKILINTTYDHYRRKSRAVDTVDLSESIESQFKALTPGPEIELCEQEIDPFIEKALESLPDNFLMPLILREIDSASYEEIAELLNIPKGTVMSRLSRARKLLRMKLGESDSACSKETGA